LPTAGSAGPIKLTLGFFKRNHHTLCVRPASEAVVDRPFATSGYHHEIRRLAFTYKPCAAGIVRYADNHYDYGKEYANARYNRHGELLSFPFRSVLKFRTPVVDELFKLSLVSE
jgi:hypothetical protein